MFTCSIDNERIHEFSHGIMEGKLGTTNSRSKDRVPLAKMAPKFDPDHNYI